MNRRTFVLTMLVAATAATSSAATKTKPRKFRFKIKTKDGGIIGNVVVEAKDPENAKYKLQQKYPGCTIIEMKED